MCDVALSAFAVFFLQSPSFLAYQRDMQRREGRNNAQSLFGVERVPSDPQIRNLLDPVAPDYLREPFWAILSLLTDSGCLAEYEHDGGLLLAFDGTGYFGSRDIHCSNCTVAVRDTAPTTRILQ